MPDPSHLDPNSPIGNPLLRLIAQVAAGTATAMTWAFATFQTKKGAERHTTEDDAKFVKKVEEDGTQTYVRFDIFQEMHKDLSEKIMANADQSRQDNRDLESKLMAGQGKMFEKIDNFTTQIMMNQKKQ